MCEMLTYLRNIYRSRLYRLGDKMFNNEMKIFINIIIISLTAFVLHEILYYLIGFMALVYMSILLNNYYKTISHALMFTFVKKHYMTMII